MPVKRRSAREGTCIRSPTVTSCHRLTSPSMLGVPRLVTRAKMPWCPQFTSTATAPPFKPPRGHRHHRRPPRPRLRDPFSPPP